MEHHVVAGVHGDRRRRDGRSPSSASPDEPELAEFADRVAAEESARQSIDRGWIWAFVATLFAIHLGRMGFDRSRLGISSPLVAVVGDVFLALVIAFAVVIPLRLDVPPAHARARAAGVALVPGRRAQGPAGAGAWSARRSSAASASRCGLRSARYSARTALDRGLQIGLPLAAIIAAIVPVFGMSWFFDTENWAAGMWNSWAEARTDTWREAMVKATFAAEKAKAPAEWYSVSPPGVRRAATSRSS